MSSLMTQLAILARSAKKMCPRIFLKINNLLNKILRKKTGVKMARTARTAKEKK